MSVEVASQGIDYFDSRLVTPEIDGQRPTRIGIMDAGSQYVKPIDRRIRELGADTIILPLETSAEELMTVCDAFIVSGGGDSVYAKDAPHCDPKIFEADYPLAGMVICYGFQEMNQALGGSVKRGITGRYGQHVITITDTANPLLADLGDSTKALINAGDCVTADTLAPNLKVIALSRVGDHETVAAFVDESGRKVGVQFHPEVDLTERGNDIFRNFITAVAGLELNYTPEAKHKVVSSRITSKIGRMPVVTAASGGVDSSVVVAAIDDEVGERQHVIHVNTGLQRKGESELVLQAFEDRGVKNVHFVDATKEFRHARTRYNGRLTRTLQYEIDPEAKRHIIGDTFARVFDREIRALGLDPDTAFLAQGTLRPDLIESAGIGAKAKKIKTHHNDTPLIRAWRERGNIVEPLSDLHKDEVRELGLELGLPEEVVWRQPFPGPGLGVRIIGAEEPADFWGRKAVEAKLRGFINRDTSLHLLPIRTVGVQGDDRTYKHVAVISSDDEPNWESYMEYAGQIPEEFSQISRVIYLSGERIAPRRSLFDSIVRTSLTPNIVELAQEADDQVNYAMREHGLLRLLSQEPVILAPLAIDGKRKGRLSVIRPFVTNDFMVGSAAVPGSEHLPLAALDAQREAALSVKGIGRFAIDLTGKPPGTTEWE